jgi:hypothetical protein
MNADRQLLYPHCRHTARYTCCGLDLVLRPPQAILQVRRQCRRGRRLLPRTRQPLLQALCARALAGEVLSHCGRGLKVAPRRAELRGQRLNLLGSRLAGRNLPPAEVS